MPVFRLSQRSVTFPPVELAESDGLLAIGGDLRVERLLAAYQSGIFPWYSEGEPLLWWSPDPRLILLPERLHIPRSLKKVLAKGRFHITFDHAFDRVIRGCAHPRKDGHGTWITEEMATAYNRLHDAGHAHSAEAWLDPGDGSPPLLVGGVYGVAVGSCFFGESMFYRVEDAAKVTFVTLVDRLLQRGCSLIDCQMTTDHLLRFGAEEVSRPLFLKFLQRALTTPPALPIGSWAALLAAEAAATRDTA